MTYSPQAHGEGGLPHSNQQKTAWLEIITPALRRLRLPMEPSEFYRLATTMIAEVFQVEKCAILLYDEARQELICQSPAYGIDPSAIERIRFSVKEGTPHRLLWERPEPLIIDDLASDPRFTDYQDLGQSLGVRSVLACDLRVDPWHLGTVMVANKRSGERFTQTDVPLLRLLTDQITLALVNAQTLNAQAREAKRAKTLSQIANLLHSTLDQREIVKVAASMMLVAVGADRCSMFLILPEPETPPTSALSVARVEAGQPWKMSETVDDERARWFREHWRSFDHDRPTIIEDVYFSPIIPSSWTTQFGIKTLVMAPLRAKDQLVGYMMIEYVEEIHHVDEEEMAFIEGLANQSALALSNAQDYQAIQSEAEPLRASVATYAPLVEGAGAAILVVQEGRYSYSSGAVVELLGYSLEELAQMHLPDIFAPPSQTAVIESYERIMEGKRIPSLDAQAMRKDGQEVTLTLTPSLIEFEGAPAVQFIAADTTEQQIDRERRLQASKLEAVTRLIGNLVGEVRNALTPVVGFTELTLDMPDLSPEVRSNLQIIAHGAERAKKTFDTLATWAQIRPPEKTQVNINRLLEQMIALRQYELQSYQIEVVLDLDRESPNTTTQADPQQLQIALLAITDNAKDALLEIPHGRRLVIQTRRKQRGFWKLSEVIEISFQDNGPGIARENLSRVFDPFYSTKPPTQALGLGLWIAYQVIKNHNGEIYVRSREGEGATFIIELPILATPELPEA